MESGLEELTQSRRPVFMSLTGLLAWQKEMRWYAEGTGFLGQPSMLEGS